MTSAPWRSGAGWALIAAGAALLVAPAASGWWARSQQTALLVANPLPATASRPAAEPLGAGWGATVAGVDEVGTGWPLTHLTISRLGLTFVVLDGANAPDQRLKLGPIHLPGSGLPGGPTQVVITGHRNVYGSPFRNLDLLEPGDQIFLRTERGTLAYRVSRHVICLPGALDPHLDRDVPGLTLLTCHPYWRPDRRLLVVADPIGLTRSPVTFAIWTAPPPDTRSHPDLSDDELAARLDLTAGYLPSSETDWGLDQPPDFNRLLAETAPGPVEWQPEPIDDAPPPRRPHRPPPPPSPAWGVGPAIQSPDEPTGETSPESQTPLEDGP